VKALIDEFMRSSFLFRAAANVLSGSVFVAMGVRTLRRTP
jgi:hypothetical protein